MRLYELFENEEEHAKALEDTGYWGNAGAGAIIMANDTKRILLPFRSSMVEQPHTWGTWGGAIDSGEDAKEAVIRELHEEAGYEGEILSIKLLTTFIDKSFRYDTFLIVVPHEFEPTLNWETERAEWFDTNDPPSPLHFGLQYVFDHVDPSMLEAFGGLAK